MTINNLKLKNFFTGKRKQYKMKKSIVIKPLSDQCVQSKNSTFKPHLAFIKKNNYIHTVIKHYENNQMQKFENSSLPVATRKKQTQKRDLRLCIFYKNDNLI